MPMNPNEQRERVGEGGRGGLREKEGGLENESVRVIRSSGRAYTCARNVCVQFGRFYALNSKGQGAHARSLHPGPRSERLDAASSDPSFR